LIHGEDFINDSVYKRLLIEREEDAVAAILFVVDEVKRQRRREYEYKTT